VKKKSKKYHGNDLDDPSDQHLYAVYDHEEKKLFKFGLSNKPIGANGKCSRMEEQERAGNLWSNSIRYVARILIRVISGRRRGRAAEDDAVRKYAAKHGQLPRGNLNHIFLAKEERDKLEKT